MANGVYKITEDFEKSLSDYDYIVKWSKVIC